MDGITLSGISQGDFKKHKMGLTPGSVVAYGLYRDGMAKTINVSMIAVPMDMVAKKLGHHILKSHMTEEVAVN